MANAPVQFGLALPMVLAHSGAGRTVAELTSEVLAAEASGFDLCLVPEHHGGPDTALTDPMVTVAWLLARTSRIKVGTGVLILPLHSLPRLAEQACFLQLASQGRLVIGIGAGYQPADFATFDVALSSRRRVMSDGIRALREVWASGEIGGHPIRPMLDGAPAPPLYVGAWTARGIDQAADLADGWIADPIRSADDTAEAAARYLRSTLAAGRQAQVLIMREAWLADTDAQARATFGPIVEPIFRYYLREGAFAGDHGLTESDLTLDGALADRVLCGSAATMITSITTLMRRTHADTLILGVRHPRGPGHDDVLTAIERLGQEVLPAVRARLADPLGSAAR